VVSNLLEFDHMFKLSQLSKVIEYGSIISLAVAIGALAVGCSSMNSSPPADTAALVAVPQGPVVESHPAPRLRAESQGHVVKASYYGDELRGQPTASGEPYNPNEMTAASKKLPIGTLVKVKNPQNGKSVVVRINDHGPYVHGRSMDLSEAAARKLGITHAGVKRLTVTKVSSESEAAKASPPPPSTAPTESTVPAESTADAVSLPDPPN
jgi:rare lipoprotein A (peptidoglycan hydrolase)